MCFHLQHAILQYKPSQACLSTRTTEITLHPHLRIHLNNYPDERDSKISTIYRFNPETCHRIHRTYRKHLVMLIRKIQWKLLRIRTAKPYQLFLSPVCVSLYCWMASLEICTSQDYVSLSG